MSDIELTDREKAIAKEAARIAIEELSDEFYKQIGKTIVNKLLILLGAVVVAFAFGKGWIVKG